MTNAQMGILSGWMKLNGKSLEVRQWRLPAAHGTIVLIHEALGSVSYWKDFPAKLAESTGCTVVAYARAGHGESDGPLEPRSSHYYQHQVQKVLPRLMEQFHIPEPILYGHSEGAMIAFLYAAAGRPLKGIVAESPIVVAAEKTLLAVEETAQEGSRAELVQKLGRYHRDPAAVFESWLEAVRLHVGSEFPATDYLTLVRCPVLAIEGALDPYGGPAQSHALEASLPFLKRVILPEAGHLPHREQPDAVLAAVTAFVSQLP